MSDKPFMATMRREREEWLSMAADLLASVHEQASIGLLHKTAAD